MPLLATASNLDMPGSGALHGILYADDFPGGDWGAKVQAAHDAAPSTGAVIDARGLTGTQGAAATLTLSKPVKILAGAATITLAGSPGISISAAGVHIEGLGEENSFFLAGANALLIAIAAGPATITDLSMTGESGSFGTATGIHITAGHAQIFRNLRMIDWGGVPFTCDPDVAHFMMLTDSLVQPADGLTTTAIQIIGTDDPLLSSALRHFTNIDTGGAIIDVGGSQTTQLVNCSCSNVTMTSDCKKLTMANCRLTSRGENTIVLGINHSIVGNVIAGPMELDASVQGCVIGPNVNVGPMVDGTFNNDNVLIDHNSYTRLQYLSIGAPLPSTGFGVYINPVYLTGTDQRAVEIALSTSSAATGQAIGLLVRAPNTQAASYTQTSNVAIYIQNGSLGAGSSVTTSYGLFIEDINLGATNFAIVSQHLGASTLAGSLSVAGQLITGSSFVINGNGGLPAAASGNLYMASGYSSPVLGKLFCGDGSGWELDIAKRTGSTDTTLFKFKDSGEFVAGSMTITGLFTAGVLSANADTGLPSSAAGQAYFTGGYGSPNAGRTVFGDGTGYQYEWAKRASSTETTVAFVTDQGEIAVLGGASVANSLTIDPSYCLNVGILTGRDSATFQGKVRMQADASFLGNVIVDDSHKVQWSDTNIYRGAAAVLKTDTAFNCASLQIGGTAVVDSSRNADVVSLKVGGTTVIDSSRTGTLVSLGLTGTPLSVASGGTNATTAAGALASLGAASAGANTAIESSHTHT